MSWQRKAVAVLAGIGAYALCASGLRAIYGLLDQNFAHVGAGRIDPGFLTFATCAPYLAVFPAALLVGWMVENRGWLYGLVAGICGQLPAVGLAFISMSRASLDLLRSPDTIFHGPGDPALGMRELWMVSVVIPLVFAAGLGAVGGLCGQRLSQRGRTVSRPEARTCSSGEDRS